jgi:hypothetical protein
MEIKISGKQIILNRKCVIDKALEILKEQCKIENIDLYKKMIKITVVDN